VCHLDALGNVEGRPRRQVAHCCGQPAPWGVSPFHLTPGPPRALQAPDVSAAAAAAEAAEAAAKTDAREVRVVQVNSRSHVPQKRTGSIPLYTNPV
jgi:hypothetical protein